MPHRNGQRGNPPQQRHQVADAPDGADRAPTALRSTDGETRREIMRIMLREGTVTAGQLGKALGLRATGIRRHLDALVRDGLAQRSGAQASDARRGRPAQRFRLTEQGRSSFGHAYDALALDALAVLQETGGSAAIRSFARQRAERIVRHVPSVQGQTPEAVERVAAALADAFQAHGYEATIATSRRGVQLCQHHCPISHAAAQFPELCEAEHEVVAERLGQHVAPLASIATGQHLCTTHIPITPHPDSPVQPEQTITQQATTNERSGS